MKSFWGVVRYEYLMTIRKWGMWFVYGLIYFWYATRFFPNGEAQPIINPELPWASAGSIVFSVNVFMPLIGGILAADRLQRDYRLGVRELQLSAPLIQWAYILGKYLGVLAAVFSPILLFHTILGILSITLDQAPINFLLILLIATVVVGLPAYAFVTAFSLACPLFMPVRVYQVLFTGYWFWGNFLNPEMFPTLRGTLLTPSGEFAFRGFFGTLFPQMDIPLYTPLDATLNLIVLALCIIAVLVALERWMQWQTRHA